MKVKSELLYAANVLLKSWDILTTTIAISIGGLRVEANPIVKSSIYFFGLELAMILNFIYFLILMSFMYYKKYNLAMGIVAMLSTFVVINNILELINMKGML